MRSVSAGPLPLYGTCVSFTWVTTWNSSPVRWVLLPVPADAISTLPGFALASAMNSVAVRTGSEGWTTSISGTIDTSDVGVKSRTGSYDGLLVNAGFTVSEPLDPSSSV